MLCGSKIAAILKSKYFQQFVHHPTQTQSELCSMFAYLLMTNEKQVRAFHLKNIISLMGVSQISTPMRLTQNFPGFLMGRGKATFKYIEYFLFMLFTYLQSFVGDHLGVMWQRPHGIAEIVGALNLILKTHLSAAFWQGSLDAMIQDSREGGELTPLQISLSFHWLLWNDLHRDLSTDFLPTIAELKKFIHRAVDTAGQGFRVVLGANWSEMN